MKRVFGLDLMRAVAILSVLYSHFLEQMPPGSFFRRLIFFNGFIGVELFFVLSGFLIGGIIIRLLRSGRLHSFDGLLDFWKRRWYRTLPNYYLFLISYVILERGSAWTFAKYSLFLQNLYWPMPEFFGVSWSLSIEEWFYLLFPISVFLLARQGISWRTNMILSLTLILIVSIGSAFLAPFQETWAGFDSYTRKMVMCRLCSLMMGVWMVYLKESGSRTWKWLVSLGFLNLLPFLILNYLSFGEIQTNCWFLRSTVAQILFFPLFSLTCALILAWMDSLKEARGAFGDATRWISDISYALYLCHMPALILVNHICRVTSINPNTTHGYYMVVYFITALLVGWAVRHFWEKPWLRLRDKNAAR